MSNETTSVARSLHSPQNGFDVGEDPRDSGGRNKLILFEWIDEALRGRPGVRWFSGGGR